MLNMRMDLLLLCVISSVHASCNLCRRTGREREGGGYGCYTGMLTCCPPGPQVPQVCSLSSLPHLDPEWLGLFVSLSNKMRVSWKNNKKHLNVCLFFHANPFYYHTDPENDAIIITSPTHPLPVWNKLLCFQE